MAIISKTNVLKFTELIGNSYNSILTGYGNYDASDSAVNLIGKAKVFIRGGNESKNGVKQVSVGSNGITLDLLPSYSGTIVTVKNGEFYLNSKRQVLQSNRTFDFSLLSGEWWYGSGFEDIGDTATIGALSGGQRRCKAVIYASDEVISPTTHIGSEDMTSGEDFQTTSATFCLDGTTDLLAAPFAAPTSDTKLDKVQLYISTNITGTEPNTGLKVYICNNNTSTTPDSPNYSSIVATSIKVSEVIAKGDWVDFIFDEECTLTGGSSYWVVLASDTPDDGSPSNLSASIYYYWHYGAAAGNDIVDPASYLQYSDNNGTTWSNHVDKLPTCRFIEYLKVKYTPVMANEQAFGEESELPIVSGVANNLEIDFINVDHCKIANCDLLTSEEDPASGYEAMDFGTDLDVNSIMTDIREIISYDGVQDDDQMSVLFPAIDRTENEIVNIATEAAASPVAADYASICTGLSSHITTLSSGSTFKSYWKANETYMTRYFRKVWEFNQNSELCARFSSLTFDEGEPTIYSDPIDTRYVSDETYCADLSTGVNLEIHIPTTSQIQSTTDVYVFGITIVNTTLNSRASIGSGYLSVSNPNIFDTESSPAKVYAWIEKDGDDNGELVKISDISGNILTLTSDSYVGATTIRTHEVGDKVWLVDLILQQITTTTGVAGANITLTPGITGSKYIGVAYVQPKGTSNLGTSGNIIEVRSV
jgi:hypothetical protein